MPGNKEIETSVWVRKNGSEITINNFEDTVAYAKSLGWKRKKGPKKEPQKDD